MTHALAAGVAMDEPAMRANRTAPGTRGMRAHLARSPHYSRWPITTRWWFYRQSTATLLGAQLAALEAQAADTGRVTSVAGGLGSAGTMYARMEERIGGE